MGPKKRKAEGANALPQSDGDWMNDILECPVCLEVMKDPPIFVCENPQGHSLCYKCHESLLKANKPCPVCRQPLGNRRNLGLEGLVDKLPKVECKFDDCDFKKSDEALVKKHEKDCVKRYIPCAYCDDSVGMKKLAAHITGEHGFGNIQYQKLTDQCIVKYASLPIPLGLDFHFQVVMKSTAVNDQDPEFLYNWWGKDEVKLLWISLIGTQDSAKKFKYSFKLRKDKNSEEKPLEITRFVLPCDISAEEVKTQKCAVILDKELIQEAKQKDEEDQDVIYYDLMIQKL